MGNTSLHERNNLLAFLPELSLFCEVVRCGGFTAAAAARHVTVSTMTRGIQRLEKTIGVKLFVRTTRRVTLTEAGTLLYQRCLPAVQAIEDAIVSARQSQLAPGGVIRVTAPASFGRRYIAAIATHFASEHRDVSVEFALDDQFRRVGEDGLDVSVRGGRIPDARFIARKIAGMPLYVCASPSYLRHRGTPERIDDLPAHDCIRFVFQGTGKEFPWEFQQDGELLTRAIAGNYVVDNIEVACQAACDGAGLAQLPGYIAAPEIRAGRLRPVLLPYLDSTRAFYLCYQERLEALPRRIQLFVDYLLRNLPGPEHFALTAAELARFTPAPATPLALSP